MEVRNLIQVYHWQTDKYARHVASGDLYASLNVSLDTFVEAYQKSGKFKVNIKGLSIRNMNDTSAKKLLVGFSDFLTKLTPMISDDPDLLNIRDDMLVNTNKTLFLFGRK